MRYLGSLFLILFTTDGMTMLAAIMTLGLFETLGLYALSAMAGIFLIRHQGLATLGRFVSSGPVRLNLEDVTDTIRICIAGGLFLLPGFLSDLAAVILLLPIWGTKVRTEGTAAEDGIIDAEYTVVPDREPERLAQSPDNTSAHR